MLVESPKVVSREQSVALVEFSPLFISWEQLQFYEQRAEKSASNVQERTCLVSGLRERQQG